MNNERIVILGIGCTLYADQGFGVGVIQALKEQFAFPENVNLVDGGLLGVGLTGTIGQADRLIAIDAISNGGNPGDIYRLDQEAILARLSGRHHVQHVEFLEALAHCQALDTPPEAVLLGIEPEDTHSVVCALTPGLQEKMGDMIAMVLKELDRLGVDAKEKMH
ncbi:MAG: hydrogenase maturation protease [Desulfobacteraceae bacterium]